MGWTEFMWVMIGAVSEAIIFSILLFIKSAHGVLRIDHSDPEKDVYRFEIDKIESLSKKKRVFLTVDHNADLLRR